MCVGLASRQSVCHWDYVTVDVTSVSNWLVYYCLWTVASLFFWSWGIEQGRSHMKGHLFCMFAKMTGILANGQWKHQLILRLYALSRPLKPPLLMIFWLTQLILLICWSVTSILLSLTSEPICFNVLKVRRHVGIYFFSVSVWLPVCFKKRALGWMLKYCSNHYTNRQICCNIYSCVMSVSILACIQLA